MVESVKDLEAEIEKLMSEIEEMRKKLKESEKLKVEEKPKTVETPVRTTPVTTTTSVAKTIPVKISYGGYDLEFNINLKPAPTISGIPESSNPSVDSELWYLRTQAMMGSDLHHRIEESLDKLRELGVSESAIEWIRKQFERPFEQRETIPLTGESERFLWDLHDRLKNIVLSKFPDAPEEQVERFIWNAIFNAVSANGWGNKEKIRRSAEGYIRNLLRGGL